MPAWAGLLLAPLLLLASVVLGSRVGTPFLSVLFIYFALTCAYSLRLKRLPLLMLTARVRTQRRLIEDLQKQLRTLYGFDRSLPEQFFSWVWRALQGASAFRADCGKICIAVNDDIEEIEDLEDIEFLELDDVAASASRRVQLPLPSGS